MFDLESDGVDELKRRARRRLVGAVVLAVAAAVVIPAFLESESRPLGQDVQIQIPPISDNGLVNRLVPRADVAVSAPSAEAGASLPAAAPGGSLSQSASVQLPPAHDQVLPSAPGQTPVKGLSAVKPLAKAADSAPAPTRQAAGAVAASAGPANGARAAKPAVRAEGFVVQLAAFAESSAAHGLEARLKSSGYPVYTEALSSSHGALTRVRVGPYASRQAAEAARAKLSAAGQHGLVEPAQ